MRIQRKCVCVCGGGWEGGSSLLFSKKDFLEEGAVGMQKSKKRRAFRSLGRTGTTGCVSQGKGKVPLRGLADGYSDQEDSEVIFTEESYSRELTWISVLRFCLLSE